MRLGIFAALVAAFVLLWSGPAAAQQESSHSFWFDSWAPRTSDRQIVDLYVAEAQLRASNDGYGRGHTYVDTINSYTTNNGPVISSGATNVVNSSSTTTDVSGSQGVTVTVTTGQQSGNATQTGSSGAWTTGGSTGDIGVNAGNPQ